MRLLARAAVLALVLAVLVGIGVAPAWAMFSTTASAGASLSSAALAAPTALAATVSGGTVTLTWTATSSTVATGTRIFRSATAGGPYTQIAEIAGTTTTTYADSPGSGAHSYVVESYDTANGANWTSLNSNEATVTAAAPSFVKVVGTASCGAPTNIVTVPAAGVAPGHTLILSVVLRGVSLNGPVVAVDSNLDAYAIDADVTNPAGVRTVILSARLAAALASGSLITVTTPISTSSSVTATEFSGIATGTRVDASVSNTGKSNFPTATIITSNPNDLLVAASGEDTNKLVYNEASGWTTSSDQLAGCGGSAKSGNHGAYKVATWGGSQTYNPTTTAGNDWATLIVAYKAG